MFYVVVFIANYLQQAPFFATYNSPLILQLLSIQFLQADRLLPPLTISKSLLARRYDLSNSLPPLDQVIRGSLITRFRQVW